MTRPTFLYILDNIRPLLEKETLTEEPIPPEFRLAVCLYRLGGRGSNKEFFSIVLMALVDAKGRFIWENCGIQGNTPDSLTFQSSNLYARLVNGEIMSEFDFSGGGVKINPVILGDSAFEFRPWVMKPYTNSTPRKEQRNFNYRLSRARMVIECAFG